MKSPIPHDLRGKTISNIIVVCVGIVVYAAVMHIGVVWSVVSSVIRVAMPMFIGFAIAFILLPLVNHVERFFNKLVFRRKPHPKLSHILSIVITYILVLALLAGFFVMLVPQVISSMKSVVNIVTKSVPRTRQDFRNMVENAAFLKPLGVETEQMMALWDSAADQLTKRLSELSTYSTVLLNNVLSIAGSIGNGVYRVLFNALVGLIASIYMLVDRDRFLAQAKKVCYATMKQPSCETLIHWARRANNIFSGFIIGKILDSLIIGVICYVCMLVFGIEYPLLISVIVGVTNIIPFFGPYIGAIPSILFLLLVNPMSALWFGIFILILQQIDGNVIGPLILGDQVGLSAFWIMLSITVGGGLFGFAGLVLSVPTFALIYAIVRTVIDRRLKDRGLPDETERYIDAPNTLTEESKSRK